MRGDRRAVSIAITHALTFGITAVLVGALMMSAGSYLSTQERHVTENQFTDIGSDVVSHINSFDRMAQSGENVEASIQPDYPDRVVGSSYWIMIDADPPDYLGTTHALKIESNALDDPLWYPLEVETELDPDAEVRSDNIRICITDDGGTTLITFGEGCE